MRWIAPVVVKISVDLRTASDGSAGLPVEL